MSESDELDELDEDDCDGEGDLRHFEFWPAFLVLFLGEGEGLGEEGLVLLALTFLLLRSFEPFSDSTLVTFDFAFECNIDGFPSSFESRREIGGFELFSLSFTADTTSKSTLSSDSEAFSSALGSSAADSPDWGRFSSRSRISLSDMLCSCWVQAEKEDPACTASDFIGAAHSHSSNVTFGS